MALRTVTPQKGRVEGEREGAQPHQLFQGREQQLEYVAVLKVTPRSLQTAGRDTHPSTAPLFVFTQ